MKIVRDKITLEELKDMAKKSFGSLIKAVVDVKREIMVVDGELHSDEESLLLEDGSNQEDLWGINIYPEAKSEEFIEFDTVINIRPSQGNRSRFVENSEIRQKILNIVNKLVVKQ